MNDVMLDIETLDTRPSAVVLSIGAVRFDIENPGSIGEEFHAHIDVDSSLSYGRTISGSTIMWWMGQDEHARSRIINANSRSVEDVLNRLALFIKNSDRVWGNGAAFDNVILSSLFKDAGIKQPWRYSNDMCYRTVKNLYQNVPQPKFVGTRHDALDDAIHQAHHLQLIYKELSFSK